MQFFNFIFLARSWASDRVQLASDLSALGRQAEQQDKPLTLILYPEGTLVSKDTRPISKKYADKLGIVSDLTRSAEPLLTLSKSWICQIFCFLDPQDCTTAYAPCHLAYLPYV
jgi:hypothetical protein